MSCHIAYTNNVPPQKTLLKRSTAALRSIGFSLLLGATLASGAQAQSTKFIPTFLVYYGGGPALGTADAAKLAKYDLIDIDRFRYDSIGSNTWSSIKALNPNTQIYLYEMGPESPSYLDSSQPQYVNGLARHNVSRGHPMGSLNGNQPGLFQKDAAGNRIYSKGYSNPSANQYWYLMDFGSSAYQSYWVTAVKADIIDQPWRADGVFVDNCTPNAAAAGYNATSAWYPTDAAWSTAMNSFIVAITAGVHGYGQKLWCNKGGTVSDAGSAAWKALDSGANPPDVLLEEGAFAVEWGANTQFFPEASWKRQIDTMGAIKNSKIALMSHTQLSEGQSGTDNWGKPVTFWQTLSYALGSFLLGKNDTLNNSYFMFNGGSGYNKIWWFDEYDKLNLGKALGTYKVSTINGVNIYSREFEKGYVYVNPTATNVASMTLPQASRQITHDNLSSAISSLPAVTTISLNGHYAAFLMKTGAATTDSTAPSVPAGLTATAASSTQINLAWTASTDNVGVTGYRVYRAGSLVATLGAVTSYQNAGLTAATSYNYTVQAIDAAGNASVQSSAASATTKTATTSDSTAPSLPAGLTATAASSTQINLAWTASTDNVGVTGYRVYRAGSLIATVGAVTSYQNTGLSAATSYAYTVQAFDAAGNASGQSNAASTTTKTATTSDTTAPSAPTSLTAAAASASQINLSWTASTDNVGVTGYRINRAGTPIATVGVVTSYQNTGLAAATSYNYTVQAIDAAGNVSSQSNATFAITPATSAADTAAPSVPTGLTASAVSGSQVKLTWQPSTDNVGVKGYIVYLNNAQLATITTGTSFQHTGLTPGTTYNYRVSAFDAVPNHSAWTATPVSVKTSTQ